MLPGFNHNVTRRGKAYHVQTEDLGTSNPFIVTHLFSAGNVVATARSGYADVLGSTDLADRVRALMEAQHKQMLRNLISGAYDPAAPAPPAPPRAAVPAPPVLHPVGESQRSPAPPRGAAEPPPIPKLVPRNSPQHPPPVQPRPHIQRIPPIVWSVSSSASAPPARGPDANEDDTNLDQVILAYLAGESGRRG